MDITNKFMVASRGDNVAILNMQSVMTPDEAINLAAWLVAVSDVKVIGKCEEFEELLTEVMNT